MCSKSHWLLVLVLGRFGISLILFVGVFVLLTFFNLFFPLFPHERVEPHGSLCVLDLTDSKERREMGVRCFTVDVLQLQNKKRKVMVWRLTDECSPCWTLTLSISLQRTLSAGREV